MLLLAGRTKTRIPETTALSNVIELLTSGMKIPRFIALALLAASISLYAGSGSTPSKFKAIPERMQGFVEDGTIAGAVTLVAHKGEVVSLEAVGFADMANKKPMRPDSLFWIASMTKPITATAIMMLEDEGKLSVNDPVEKYLPEFKNQWMIERRTNETIILKRPQRPITLRDLLTHTSGLSDLSAPRPNCTLAELAMAYSQLPLKFPPGTRWEYCNSGINVLGRIVEVASGESFADFLQDRIFKPLGMKDTTFWPGASQAKRLAKSYQPAKAGKVLEETSIGFIKGDLSDRSRTAFPSGGLFSTAQDMWRFYQMALNGGEVNGKRIISRESVDVMTRTQTGDIRTGFTDGMSFGYGWAVVKKPAGVTETLSAGTFGHGGAYGTQGWVDPKKELICVLMIQRVRLPNADASPIRKAFQDAAVAAIAE
jgi:CubicO group peptidase (beta-lactamase class C family)